MSRKGRKRLDAPRHTGGKLKQPAPEERMEKVMAVALSARERVFDLSAESAKAMPETTPLGRLCATGEISRRQYLASRHYAEVCADYERAILARGLPSGSDFNRTRSHDGADGSDEEYRDWCKRKIERYDECNRALLEANKVDKSASAATKYLVLVGIDRPDLVASLRVGLNRLAQYFRLPVDDEVAGERAA